MGTNIARLISSLFHPLLITNYFLLIILNPGFYLTIALPENAKWMIVGMVFITTFLLPLMMNSMIVFLLKKVTSPEVGDKRNMQLLMVTVFYFLTYYLLDSVHFSPVFNLYILGATLLATMVLIINFYWKISVFMTSCGALTGAFTGITLSNKSGVLILIFISLLISGLTGFSRLKLQTHSPAQVYSGFGLGAIIMTMVFLMF